MGYEIEYTTSKGLNLRKNSLSQLIKLHSTFDETKTPTENIANSHGNVWRGFFLTPNVTPR